MKRQIENRHVPLLIAVVILIALTVFAFLLLSPSAITEEPAGYSGIIRILTTPDIHSHILAMSENDTGSRIGRIGALADALGEEEKNTLYLFAGDLGDGNFYHTYAGDDLIWHPVGQAVSHRSEDNPSLIEPLPECREQWW